MESFSILSGLLCFVSSFILDVIWALYVRRTAEGHPIESSLLAGGIMLVGAINTIAYVQNHWNLVFSIVGAIVGTYCTLLYESKQKGKMKKD